MEDAAPVLRFHFTRGTGPGGWVVRTWTASDFAHVSMSLAGTYVDAVPGQGIRYREPPPKGCITIAFPLTDAQAQAVLLFWDSEIREGGGYDYFGVLRAGIACLARGTEHDWFCSEAGAATAKRAELLPPEHGEWRESPESLHDLLRALHFLISKAA